MGMRSRLLGASALLCVLGCGPISLSEEQQLGQQFEQQMRSQAPILHDRVVDDYIDDMGEGIVRAAGPQPFDYRFTVVQADEINAFAGPGGHIYIHTETILRARNASELAGVLAHEVAHVQKRHIAENYNRARNARIGTDLLSLGASAFGGGLAGSAASLGGGLAATTWLNTFGREAEAEADAFAVAVMVRAGWNPEGLLTFFEALLRSDAARVPVFLSSHPTTEDRIQATRVELQRLDGTRGLATHDGGKLEIIQRRVRLLTRARN